MDTTKNKNRESNQMIFVEYTKIDEKHRNYLSVTDRYKNILGRAEKTYNKEDKRYEYRAFDREGKPMFEGKVFLKEWEMKDTFLENEKELLKAAHERRIEAKKGKSTETPAQENSETKRKDELEKVREEKETQEKSQGLSR